MPITISKNLVGKLPEAQRGNVEQELWDKSGGVCWLCDEAFNRASDDIQADHDIPEAEGGDNDVSNLNLAHASCNKAKRNAKTADVRPWLRLRAFSQNHGGRLKYDGFLEHFGIEPMPSVVSQSGTTAVFEFPNGTRTEVPIFSDRNVTASFEYVYVRVPRSAIFNDAACQPRVVRPSHVFDIYTDLQRNPLHEQPSCRLEHTRNGEPVKLLLFDGQHKTIASWMTGSESLTAKVYLNLSTAQANELVNSIQAKIKKLPLSPFELAGKMADEWENKFSEYESVVGSTEVSEDGFIKWLPQTERTRGKQALHAALLQNVLSSPEFRLAALVKQPGGRAAPFGFTEQQLKSKVLERLIIKLPLKEKGEEAQTVRDDEAANITRVLNILADFGFFPSDPNTPMTSVEEERARRMSYQSSLVTLSGLIRQMWDRLTLTQDSRIPMKQKLDDERWSDLTAAIKLLVEHPVWTADFDRDEKMAAVKNSLEKNQAAQESFNEVGFDFAYMVLGKDAPMYKQYWT